MKQKGLFCLNEKYNGRIAPTISIVNTNIKIIEKIISNLYSLGCSWLSQEVLAKNNNKAFTRIYLSGFGNFLRFLGLTQNLWVSERNRLRTSYIKKFIESRFSKAMNLSYTSEEYDLSFKVCRFNNG